MESKPDKFESKDEKDSVESATAATAKDKKELSKRAVALHVGYVGTGYKGVRNQTNVHCT